MLEDKLRYHRAREAELQAEVDKLRAMLLSLEAEKVHLRELNLGLEAAFVLYKDETGAKIDFLNLQYTACFAQLEPLKEKLREAESTVSLRDAMVVSLQGQLAQPREVIHLETSVQEIKVDTSALEAELAAMVHECQRLKAAEANWAAEVKALKDEIKGLRLREAELVQLNHQLRTMKEQAESERDSIRAVYHTYKDETTIKIEALCQQYAECHGQLEAAREKIRQLEALLRNKDTTINALEAALLAARHAGGNLTSLQAQLGQMKMERDALLVEVEKLKSLLEAEKRVLHLHEDPTFKDMSALLVQMKDDTAAKLYQLKYEEMKKQHMEICEKYQHLSDRCLQQESVARAQKQVLAEELEALRRKNEELQAAVDQLRVVTSHVEIEKNQLKQERDGLGGMIAVRTDEADQKLHVLTNQYNEAILTCEALREKCRQLESSLAIKEVTISSLRSAMTIKDYESVHMKDTSVEIKHLEEEMTRIANRGAQSLQQLQIDVLRLQMQGKKVQQREVFQKIDHEFDRADKDKDGQISKEDFEETFGMKSPTRRQWEKMDADNSGFVTREEFAAAIITNVVDEVEELSPRSKEVI